jgi:hypothetical protein
MPGRLMGLLPHLRVTNTGFDLGIHAVFRQTSLLPAKTRAFLDFLVEAMPAVAGKSTTPHLD